MSDLSLAHHALSERSDWASKKPSAGARIAGSKVITT